ncbi:MAG: Sensory box histidine kinaseresponse regulator [Rhodospirillales bacterium]|nr:Sensory box histidine kinaseresponse regulator [Rhodospirillales bacterium]
MTTILLVEDDEAFLYSAARHLTEAGYQVVIAADSMAALRELGSEAIDLLVTDIVMPHGKPHGIALARMARMRFAALPIILITGYDNVVGGDSDLPGPLLQKPVGMEVLTQTISKLLAA